MEDPVKYYPIAIIQDRYGGIYSGGRWLAIANSNLPVGNMSRVDFVLCDDGVGPSGCDDEAMEYWKAPDDWIAAGGTPDEAMKNLLTRAQLV